MLQPNKIQLNKFLFATSLGTYLEFFDLALYSFCSPLIARHFFPSSNSASGIILTWAIFAVSYIMRPMGAMWFGHLADIKGGKKAMLISMVMMASATIAIGILPPYAKIGIISPLLLLVCRIMQSIAVSPEYNLSSVFIKNNAWCEKHYGFVSSISASVTGLGMLSASMIMSIILGNNTIENVADYKWRLPFIIAGVLLGTIGIYSRLSIDDSITQQPIEKFIPFKEVLRNQKHDFFRAIIIAGYIGCITYALFSFLVYQLENVRNMTPGAALSFLSYSTAIPALFSLLSGYLSDYVPRRYLMLISTFVILTSGYSLFSHLHFISELAILIEASIMLAGLGFFAGSFPGLLADLFKKEYRYTGSFLAYNIGMSLIGGFSPLVFITLEKINSGLPIALIIAYSLIIILLLSRSLLRFETKPSTAYNAQNY